MLIHGRGSDFSSSSVELRLRRHETGTWSCEAVALDTIDIVVEGDPLAGREFWKNVTGRVEVGYAEWKPGAHVFVRYELRRPGEGGPQTRTELVRILAP